MAYKCTLGKVDLRDRALLRYKKQLIDDYSNSVKPMFISILLSIENYFTLFMGTLIETIYLYVIITQISIKENIVQFEIVDETGSMTAYSYINILKENWEDVLAADVIEKKCWKKRRRKRKNKRKKKKKSKSERKNKDPIIEDLNIKMNQYYKIYGFYRDSSIHPGKLFILKMTPVTDFSELFRHRMKTFNLVLKYESNSRFYDLKIMNEYGDIKLPFLLSNHFGEEETGNLRSNEHSLLMNSVNSLKKSCKSYRINPESNLDFDAENVKFKWILFESEDSYESDSDDENKLNMTREMIQLEELKRLESLRELRNAKLSKDSNRETIKEEMESKTGRAVSLEKQRNPLRSGRAEETLLYEPKQLKMIRKLRYNVAKHDSDDGEEEDRFVLNKYEQCLWDDLKKPEEVRGFEELTVELKKELMIDLNDNSLNGSQLEESASPRTLNDFIELEKLRASIFDVEKFELIDSTGWITPKLEVDLKLKEKDLFEDLELDEINLETLGKIDDEEEERRCGFLAWLTMKRWLVSEQKKVRKELVYLDKMENLNEVKELKDRLSNLEYCDSLQPDKLFTSKILMQLRSPKEEVKEKKKIEEDYKDREGEKEHEKMESFERFDYLQPPNPNELSVGEPEFVEEDFIRVPLHMTAAGVRDRFRINKQREIVDHRRRSMRPSKKLKLWLNQHRNGKHRKKRKKYQHEEVVKEYKNLDDERKKFKEIYSFGYKKVTIFEIIMEHGNDDFGVHRNEILNSLPLNFSSKQAEDVIEFLEKHEYIYSPAEDFYKINLDKFGMKDELES